MRTQVKNRETVRESNDIITLAKSFHHKTLEEITAEFDGKLMLDGEYNWGKPFGREVWQWSIFIRKVFLIIKNNSHLISGTIQSFLELMGICLLTNPSLICM